MTLRIADLCCCAGGAARGIADELPDAEITGFDIRPQARYPYRFVQQDALTVDLDGFDFVWASPPCQHYTRGRRQQRAYGDNPYPDLIAPMRAKLEAWGGPWIMENVEGAPLRTTVMLCGEMFGMRVLRHRLFESNFLIPNLPHPKHRGTLLDGSYVAVYGAKWRASGAKGDFGRLPLESNHIETWKAVMGIDWMTKAELAEAIPPAYSRYLAQFIPLDSTALRAA